MPPPEPTALASLVDSVPCGLLLFDDDGFIVDLNATLLRWLGVPRGELVGQHVDRILPAGGRIFYQTHLFPLLQSAEELSEMYFALRGRERKEIPVLLSGRRVLSAEKPVNLLSAVVIDNRQQFEGALINAWHAEQSAREESEEKSVALDQLVEELRTSNAELTVVQAQLRESNQLKDEFVGLIAHELRNPLMALSGTFAFLSRTAEQESRGDLRSMLAELHVEFYRLLTVIDNLLVIARSEVANLLETEPLLVRQLIAASVSRHQSIDRTLNIEAHLDEDADIALGSGDLCQQILDNFLSNAAKYRAPGTAIVVRAARRQSTVDITVSNEGDLLTEEEVGRFFAAFYRDERHRTKAPGVGLGLTVCQRLAAAQDGSISGRPRAGGGLEITLSLLAAEPAER